jgi:carbon storage regulator
MLVLGRKLGESVCIGNSIEVTVLEVCGNRVRIGIKAPPEVKVLRNELLPASPDAGADLFRPVRTLSAPALTP